MLRKNKFIIILFILFTLTIIHLKVVNADTTIVETIVQENKEIIKLQNKIKEIEYSKEQHNKKINEEKVITQEEINLWTTDSVIYRSGPGILYTQCGVLDEEYNIILTGKCNNGWLQVKIDNEIYYILDENITEEEPKKPEPIVAQEVEEQPTTALENYLTGVSMDGIELQYSAPYNISSSHLTKSGGVYNYNGHRETYYDEKVLPGGGLRIPGRHVAEDGTIRDENGYICVAADPSYMSYGSTLMTSLGPAKVYDSGCAYGTIDIYVNW